MKAFFQRHSLIAYFSLSYTYFWLYLVLAIIILQLFQITPENAPASLVVWIAVPGSWMPNLAAATVTGCTDGWAGVRRLFSKFIQFRAGVTAYLATLLPLALAFAAAGLYQLFGGPVPGGQELPLGFWIGLVGMNLIQGATGEEAGWRGFALPRLQAMHGPVLASLILGLLWNFWHLPLWFMMGGYSGLDFLGYILAFTVSIVSLTFVMTWISNRASRSLVPIVLIHFFFNTSLNLVDLRGLGLIPSQPALYIMAGLLLLAALPIGFSFIQRKAEPREYGRDLAISYTNQKG